MRNLIFISLLFVFGCTAPTSPLIERNKEVKEYFDLLENLVDEYCNMVEKLVDNAIAMDEKEEPVDTIDGFNMFSDMLTSGVRMAELAEEIEEMEEQHAHFEDELSARDFKEFMSLYTTAIKRFYEMGKKLEEHEKKKEE